MSGRRNLDLASALASALALALALVSDLAKVMDRLIGDLGSISDDHPLVSDDDAPPDIVLWDLTASIIYVLLGVPYSFSSIDEPEQVGIEAEALSPDADAAMSFDRMWGFVERASASERLSKGDDDEIRVLNQMPQLAAELPRHPDLYDDIVRRVESLLSAVYAATTPPGTPIPASLELAKNQAEDEATLTVLANDMEAALANLVAAAGVVDEASDVENTAAASTAESDEEDETVEPLFPGVIGRLHHLFRRIDATKAKLAQTSTGRAVLRGTASAATTVAVSAAHPAAALVTGAASAIYTAFGDWIYTEIRRRRPKLPPRNSPDA